MNRDRHSCLAVRTEAWRAPGLALVLHVSDLSPEVQPQLPRRDPVGSLHPCLSSWKRSQGGRGCVPVERRGGGRGCLQGPRRKLSGSSSPPFQSLFVNIIRGHGRCLYMK